MSFCDECEIFKTNNLKDKMIKGIMLLRKQIVVSQFIFTFTRIDYFRWNEECLAE